MAVFEYIAVLFLSKLNHLDASFNERQLITPGPKSNFNRSEMRDESAANDVVK